MSSQADLSNQRFGRLVVIEAATERDPRRNIPWVCQCDCGKRIKVKGASLRSGTTTSCGCYRRDRLQAALVGKTRKRTTKQTYTCAECGKVFQRYPSLTVGIDKPYCSRACVGLSKRHGSVLYCHMCDTPFYRHFAEQDVGTKQRQFCSRTCYMDWRALNRKSSTYPKNGARHIHRQIAEQYLGRALLPSEVVHHIDLDKHNYGPSNLAVLPSQAYHAKVHRGKVSDADVQRFSLTAIG
jgi:hypothetical protein